MPRSKSKTFLGSKNVSQGRWKWGGIDMWNEDAMRKQGLTEDEIRAYMDWHFGRGVEYYLDRLFIAKCQGEVT